MLLRFRLLIDDQSVVAVLLGVLLLVVLVEGEPSGAHGGDGSHLLLDPVAVLVLRVLLGLVLLMLQSHTQEHIDAYQIKS